MSFDVIGMALVVISMVLALGKWVRLRIPLLQRLFLPSALIGGFLALLLGPGVLGRINQSLFGSRFLENGLFTADILEVWGALPGLLINVVFACLFIGFRLPNMKEMLRVGGPQIAFGYTLSWGQYVVGISLCLLFLTPVFGLPPAAGALIEIGFVGGHGTAAGLESTFTQLGFEQGYDLAIGLATVGVLSGVIAGVILLNWGVRRNKSNILKKPEDVSVDAQLGINEHEARDAAGKMTTSPTSIDPLAFHVALVAIAVFTGYLLLEALVWLESVTWGAWSGVYIFEYIPLFPLAMIGGILLQLVFTKWDRFDIIDRGLINRIQGLSLDLLIVSALASLQLSVLGTYFLPFLILAVSGILLNVLGFIYLAPRMIPSYWFERALGDFGQSTGVAATGLLLMRVADPENKSPAFTAFGYKQILFEPMVGGGLVTAASIPFIYQFGALPVLIVVTALMIAFMLLGLLYFGRKREASSEK
ncbi:sodium:glutamate symporter [Marinococcus halophilus]|uniref:Sodium:glutamate symporter n=1 Tax=Marinococcus halophilus TaxID=1371 RepID=A0A510Y4T5_MARHA|nr:sodium/glutamate symporter [Marinococcus halophilus]OZT81602.1 sodium:glutamate symporter [Marinococcus halophilus]GEK57547.1 sodium:glutamate symporter [Marinococcus halophilus]